MSDFLYISNELHLFSLFIILWKIFVKKNVQGISLKTQELILFSTLLFDLSEIFINSITLSQLLLMIIFINISIIICYKIRYNDDTSFGYRSDLDSFPQVKYLLLITMIVAAFFSRNPIESIENYFLILSLLLKPVALIPQIQMYKHYRQVDMVSGCYFTIISGASCIFHNSSWEEGISDDDGFLMFILLLITVLTGFSGTCFSSVNTTTTTRRNNNTCSVIYRTKFICSACWDCCTRRIRWILIFNGILSYIFAYCIFWTSDVHPKVYYRIFFVLFFVCFLFSRVYNKYQEKKESGREQFEDYDTLSQIDEDNYNTKDDVTTTMTVNNDNQYSDRPSPMHNNNINERDNCLGLDMFPGHILNLVENNSGEERNNNRENLQPLLNPDTKMTLLTLISWAFSFFVCTYNRDYYYDKNVRELSFWSPVFIFFPAYIIAYRIYHRSSIVDETEHQVSEEHEMAEVTTTQTANFNIGNYKDNVTTDTNTKLVTPSVDEETNSYIFARNPRRFMYTTEEENIDQLKAPLLIN